MSFAFLVSRKFERGIFASRGRLAQHDDAVVVAILCCGVNIGTAAAALSRSARFAQGERFAHRHQIEPLTPEAYVDRHAPQSTPDRVCMRCCSFRSIAESH